MNRTQWTYEKVVKGIKEVMKTLDIDRMPSRSEIEMVTGNTSLANKVYRTGGYRAWAEELGLSLKECETQKGNDWEFKIMEELLSTGYEVEKMSTKHPYDLLVENFIKIDVKVSSYYKGKNYQYHTFNLGKTHHNCDIFILVGLDDEGKAVKRLIIPSKFLMGKKQISVGLTSEYDKFNERCDYIDKYIDFYKEL